MYNSTSSIQVVFNGNYLLDYTIITNNLHFITRHVSSFFIFFPLLCFIELNCGPMVSYNLSDEKMMIKSW